MGSNGKKKTTMAKIMRENRLRERRMIKQAKKDARKLASLDGSGQPGDAPSGEALDPTIGELPAPRPAEPLSRRAARGRAGHRRAGHRRAGPAEPVVQLLGDA